MARWFQTTNVVPNFPANYNLAPTQLAPVVRLHRAPDGVVILAQVFAELPAAIDLVSRRERVILDVCADPGFTPAKLRETVRRAGEIY